MTGEVVKYFKSDFLVPIAIRIKFQIACFKF